MWKLSNIYVVIGESGDWSDKDVELLEAYTDRKFAEAAVFKYSEQESIHQDWFNKYCVHRRGLKTAEDEQLNKTHFAKTKWEEWEKNQMKYDLLKEKDELAKKLAGPEPFRQYQCDRYTVQEVIVKDFKSYNENSGN